MATSIQAKPDIVGKITEFVETHPGCNINQVSMGLIAHFIPNYVQVRVKQMIARGHLVAAVSETHRYSLYTPDQAPVQEEA